jgi:hypothetical protein
MPVPPRRWFDGRPEGRTFAGEDRPATILADHRLRSAEHDAQRKIRPSAQPPAVSARGHRHPTAATAATTAAAPAAVRTTTAAAITAA